MMFNQMPICCNHLNNDLHAWLPFKQESLSGCKKEDPDLVFSQREEEMETEVTGHRPPHWLPSVFRRGPRPLK